MQTLKNHMKLLFAQREQFIHSFHAVNVNVEENTTRLLACARLLMKNQSPFFSCTNINQALIALVQSKELVKTDYMLKLQLYARVQGNAFEVLLGLYRSDNEILKNSAPLFGLLTQSEDTAEAAIDNEPLLRKQLVSYFYRQEYNRITDIANIQKNAYTSLTRLYITVLSDKVVLSPTLLNDFIACHYLQMPLFELYIIRLDEASLTSVVNQLSTNEGNVDLLIKLMALSGYSKFIPFLARYLQNKRYAVDAHHALRILLGNKLDTLIPDYIQFSSKEEQLVDDLCYYGAKILHHWNESLFPSLGARLLSGLPVNKENLDLLLKSGSQAHRRVAALHQTQFPNNGVVYYYSQPGLVL